MEKDKKSPFRAFAEKASEIRKRPLSPKVIQEINNLSKEIEDEDAEKEKSTDNRQIASKPLNANL